MEKPSIEIKGVSGSGKSSLAWAIKHALKQHGVDCDIIGDEDEMPGVMDAMWGERLQILHGETITIETIRTRR